MFEDILNAVKNELGGHPAIAGNVTPEQEAAIHDEIAQHITNAAGTSSSGGGILSNLQQAISSGGTAANAIEGGLIGSLTSRFGLPPAVTGAIAAALPGLLQKFAARPQE